MNVTGYGLTLTVPDGWTGRVLLKPDHPAEGDVTNVVLQAASIPLVRDDTDLATYTRNQLGSDDAVIVLVESPSPSSQVQAEFASLQGSLELRSEDSSALQGVPADYAGYRRLFAVNGRFFGLFVTFGSAPPSRRSFSAVLASLASLKVDAAVATPA